MDCNLCDEHGMVVCPKCKGTGKDPKDPKKTCTNCFGKKKLICGNCFGRKIVSTM